WGDLSKAGANTPIHMNFEGENAASLVYSFPSAIVDLSYICIIAYDDVLRPLETLRFVFMLGLTVIAVLGSLLIFYFMKQNYAPIHSLGQLSKTMLGDAPVELGHARDALETTRLAMTAIYQSNRAATLANQRMRRESLLLGLFRGVLLDMEPFASQAHAVDMFLEGPEFRVALFFFGKRLSDQNLPNIGRYLESALNTAADAYIVEYAEDNSVIALLSGDASGMASVDGLLSELADNLRVYSSTLAIGLSERFCSLGEASAHYRQALVAAKYHTPEGGGYGRAAVSDGGVVGGGVVRVSGDGGSPAVGGGESHIVRYGEMNANMPIDAYPTDGLSTLHDAILTGDTEHIEFAIDMLLPYFQNIGSLFFIICLGYDIVNTALRAMRELNYPYFEFGRKYPELLLKSGFSSVDEIVEIVKTLSLEICNYLSSNSSGDGEGDGGARGGIGNVGAVSSGLGGASSAQSRGRTDRKQNDDGRDARDAANDADHRNGGGEWDIDESAVELDEAQAADIRIVLDYVQGHYTETSFSVKTLANDFGMSISSFSRFFKKHTNKLISNYITFLRLEKTKELLRTTTLPLAEIAEDSGYGHVSTLVRVFKQIEGITPGMYRSRYTVVPPGEQRGIRHPIKHEY
ncbi:MAG: helix-turn-helix domain-containing protein, partial [Clostridiales bacterium]|nr:helix-turn-helix domain-containing protein [Clostridiales bacterium]